MKQYIITQDVIEAFLKYLSGKPYNEVHEGIKALTELKEIPIVEDEQLDLV